MESFLHRASKRWVSLGVLQPTFEMQKFGNSIIVRTTLLSASGLSKLPRNQRGRVGLYRGARPRPGHLGAPPGRPSLLPEPGSAQGRP